MPISLPGYFLAGGTAWNISSAAQFDPVEALNVHYFQDKNDNIAEALILMGLK